jgi:hypothetical protein
MQIRGTFAPAIAAGHEVVALVRDKKRAMALSGAILIEGEARSRAALAG